MEFDNQNEALSHEKILLQNKYNVIPMNSGNIFTLGKKIQMNLQK